MANEQPGLITSRPQGLLDVLDRILDKGLVVAGDIKVSIVNVELLTLQIRLLICSIDKAEQIGINWWRNDPFLTGRPLNAGTGGPQESASPGERPSEVASGEAPPQDTPPADTGGESDLPERPRENAGPRKGRRSRAREPEAEG